MISPIMSKIAQFSEKSQGILGVKANDCKGHYNLLMMLQRIVWISHSLVSVSQIWNWKQITSQIHVLDLPKSDEHHILRSHGSLLVRSNVCISIQSIHWQEPDWFLIRATSKWFIVSTEDSLNSKLLEWFYWNTNSEEFVSNLQRWSTRT